MGQKHYPLEYRRRIVELHRSGRRVFELVREFKIPGSTIHRWIAQAQVDLGQRDGLTTDEKTELARLRREVAELREEKEILKKIRGLVRPGSELDAEEAFRFVASHQAMHDVTKLCRALDRSPSGFYAWREREPSEREKADAELTLKIQLAHEQSRATYGVPRVHAVLAAEGIHVGKKRVARLMKLAGLEGISRRRKYSTTTRDRDVRPAPDLVDRKFVATAPNQLWVADITYVPTWVGFLYLAVVLDVYSRRIVGWAMANHLRTELVVDALNMAVGQRQPMTVIHHSDQGCQYTSVAFGLRCREVGVKPSMGSVGDAYDNAMCESFFATLECELLDRRRFKTHAEAEMAIFDFIEGFYNTHRIHSALDYRSPIDYEQQQAAA